MNKIFASKNSNKESDKMKIDKTRNFYMMPESDFEIYCKECGYNLPKELIEKSIKGKEIYCEKCGNKIKLEQVEREFKEESPNKNQIRLNKLGSQPIIRSKRPFYLKLVAFFKKRKFKLRRFYYRIVNKLHFNRRRGRRKRHRRGRFK